MINIDTLKELLKDDRLHIGMAIIKKLHLAEDFSYLKVSMDVLPELREIVATMTWESVGPESGDYEFPSPGDLVLFAQAEGDDDNAYVIKRMSSRADKIPQSAITGDKVHKAKPGKKYWNISDTKIFLSKSDAEPTENLVLGQVFKSFAQDCLEVLKSHAMLDSTHTHNGNLGFVTGPPTEAADYEDIEADYDDLKASPIDDDLILSELAYTEK